MPELTVEDVKNYLRITGTEDNDDLAGLIMSAKLLIIGQTGKHYAGSVPIEQNELFKTAQKQLVAMAYTNKEGIVSNTPMAIPHSAEAIIDLIKCSSNYQREAEGAGT